MTPIITPTTSEATKTVAPISPIRRKAKTNATGSDHRSSPSVRYRREPGRPVFEQSHELLRAEEGDRDEGTPADPVDGERGQVAQLEAERGDETGEGEVHRRGQDRRDEQGDHLRAREPSPSSGIGPRREYLLVMLRVRPRSSGRSLVSTDSRSRGPSHLG